MWFRRGGWRESSAVVLAFSALTIALTYPLSLHLGTVARADVADGQFSIWNVAWVARALLTDPTHLFDANIFYPRTGTLVYSEANLAAGALAVPVYWATANAYAAHNSVVVLSFLLSAIGTYCLVRYLTGDRAAAVVGAVCFAYCPHVYSHLPHIQLLMTAGLPFSLLALHRLADSPSAGRGATLGLTMAAEAYACAYYSIFAMLIIGLAAVIIASIRRLWTNRPYWTAIGVGAAVAVALTAPLVYRYVSLSQATGFGRSLDESRRFSADWRAYFASNAYAHLWMLKLIGQWNEVLFPGFVTLVFGLVGLVVGWTKKREIVLVYGAIGALALWASFGPDAGLYRVLYAMVPGFTFLRAPSRFGLLVVLALSVLAGVAVAALLARTRRPAAVAALIIGLTIAESFHPLTFPPVPPVEPAYEMLARLPAGAVLELPVYSNRFAFLRARYMLASTTHWKPLVDAYSDYIPRDFAAIEGVLGQFPTRDSFALIPSVGARYAVFHLEQYRGDQKETLLARLREFEPYLRRLYADDRIWMYEIVGAPS
jgi:hypothetical protein